MNAIAKNALVTSLSKSSRFFEVDIKISVFGKIIWSYHFPPKSNENDEN